MKNRTAIRGWLASVRGVGAVAAVLAGATFGATQGFAQSAGQEGGAAQAVQQEAQPVVRKSDVGPSALAWLDLQRSNAQAAPAQPMLGAEAGLAYKRYMESFKNKIPEHYSSTIGTSGGSGSGSSGGSGGGTAGSGGWN